MKEVSVWRIMNDDGSFLERLFNCFRKIMNYCETNFNWSLDGLRHDLETSYNTFLPGKSSVHTQITFLRFETLYTNYRKFIFARIC